jgi:hypothetical protein
MISLVSTASRVSLKYSPDFSPKDLSASKILETESFIVATSNYYPTQENKRGYIEKIKSIKFGAFHLERRESKPKA